jgi:hypothetical protein
MKIEADTISAYSLTSEAAPQGITVERSAGGATKSFEVVLDINVDLTLISAIAAASWVLKPIISSLRRGKNMYVNGQLLPPDEAGARKMITDAIEAEQQENRSRD